MRRALRWLAVLLVVIAGGIGLTMVAARFHDGPLGPFSGGVFRSGEQVPAPGNWDFAKDERTLELELPPDAGRSVTTWFAVVDGLLYVPSGLAERKQWPKLVLADGRVRVRLMDRVYVLTAARVDDVATLAHVAPEIGAKYHVPDNGFGTRDWIFALTPRE
jgi:hypothetical protein